MEKPSLINLLCMSIVPEAKGNRLSSKTLLSSLILKFKSLIGFYLSLETLGIYKPLEAWELILNPQSQWRNKSRSYNTSS